MSRPFGATTFGDVLCSLSFCFPPRVARSSIPDFQKMCVRSWLLGCEMHEANSCTQQCIVPCLTWLECHTASGSDLIMKRRVCNV